jgi:hypothetical protein
MKTYTKNNRCTSVGSTSCMVYTGPSIPDLNIYCDSDLNDVLSILTTKVLAALNSKGIDLSGVNTSCINISSTDKKDLVKLLNAMINKLCALEISGIGIETNIENVKVILSSLPTGFFSCLSAINYTDCDSEVTLSQLLSHVISEICSKFVLKTDQSYRLIDDNYTTLANIINTYESNVTKISQLIENTGNTKVGVIGSSTPISLSSAITNINSTLGSLINTVTGSPNFSTTLNVTPTSVGGSGYPSENTNVVVKNYLGWLAYDVTLLKTQMGLLGGSCGSFAISNDSSTATSVKLYVRNVRNINNVQILIKSSGTYTFIPIQSNIIGVTLASGATANLFDFRISATITSTNTYEVIVYNGSNCVKSFIVGSYNDTLNPPINQLT